MTKKRADISFLLAILFGPFGMFYWGLKLGLASIIGTALFILLTTYFNYDVNFWYQVLIRVVFIVINAKMLGMTKQDHDNLSSMGLKEFALLIGMVILNFAFFGFIGFILYSFFNRFLS